MKTETSPVSNVSVESYEESCKEKFAADKLFYENVIRYQQTGKYTPGTSESEKRKIRRRISCFQWDEGAKILYFITNDQRRKRVIQTYEEMKSTLEVHHSGPEGGHSGWNSTLEKVSGSCFWRQMAKDTQHYIATCPKCQRSPSVKPQAAKIKEQTEVMGVDVIVGADVQGSQTKEGTVEHRAVKSEEKGEEMSVDEEPPATSKVEKEGMNAGEEVPGKTEGEKEGIDADEKPPGRTEGEKEGMDTGEEPPATPEGVPTLPEALGQIDNNLKPTSNTCDDDAVPSMLQNSSKQAVVTADDRDTGTYSGIDVVQCNSEPGLAKSTDAFLSEPETDPPSPHHQTPAPCPPSPPESPQMKRSQDIEKATATKRRKDIEVSATGPHMKDNMELRAKEHEMAMEMKEMEKDYRLLKMQWLKEEMELQKIRKEKEKKEIEAASAVIKAANAVIQHFRGQSEVNGNKM